MGYSIDVQQDLLKIVLNEDSSNIDFDKIAKEIKSNKGIKVIYLDMKNYDFIQSKTISQIIFLKKLASSIESDFILTNVQEAVYQTFEMTNLTHLFKFENDFTTYSSDELINLLYDQEYADKVSDFMSLNYDDFQDLLYKLLDSEDYLLKEYAVLTIGKAHDTDALPKIKNVLHENVPNTSRACILVLGWFGDVDSKDEIYEFLKSDDESLAEAAAASISLLCDESDSARLEKMINVADLSLRYAIYRAISLINDDYSLNILVKQLDKESDENLKANLIKYISFFNKPEVADLLLSKLDDDSLKVREAAASSLIRINAQDKVEEILEKVTDSDSWVGYFATKAIGELTSDKNISNKLIEIYKDVAENVKLAILEALGKMSNDCSDFLYQLIDDDNEDIRKEALASLFLINKELAADASMEIIDKEDSWIVRFKAVEILSAVKPNGFKEKLKTVEVNETNRYVKEKIMMVLEEL